MIANIIQQYPDVFSSQGGHITEKEALNLVLTVEPQGSVLRNETIYVRKYFAAVGILLASGLRDVSMALAEDMFQKAEQYNEHYVAHQLAVWLTLHHYQYMDGDKARHYEAVADRLYKVLGNESRYCILNSQLTYQYKHGLEINHDQLREQIKGLKESLEYGGTYTRLCYYNCRLILVKGDLEKEEAIHLEALDYYDGLWIDHSNMKGAYLSALLDIYKKRGMGSVGLDLVRSYLKTAATGSGTWKLFKMKEVELLLDRGEARAAFSKSHEMIDSKYFNHMTTDLQQQWLSLKEQADKMHYKKRYTFSRGVDEDMDGL